MAETHWIREKIAAKHERDCELVRDKQWQMFAERKKAGAFNAEFRRLADALRRDTESINTELGGGNTFQFNPIQSHWAVLKSVKASFRRSSFRLRCRGSVQRTCP